MFSYQMLLLPGKKTVFMVLENYHKSVVYLSEGENLDIWMLVENLVMSLLSDIQSVNLDGQHLYSYALN